MSKYYKNDNGIVFPIIVIVFSIMMILGFSLLNVTRSETKINIRDEESKKALQYAEAGYNRYLWHLNDDINFYSIEPKLLDEETRKLVNEEAIKFNDGYYKIKVEKPSDTDRYVTIISTGWTESNPSNKKTIVAKIRKKEFVHQVYVSDNDGPNIWWTTGDESHGAYHTNGTLRVQGKPKFYDKVTYSNSINNKVKIQDNKAVYLAGNPKKVEKLEFPKNNEDLKKWAEKDNMVFTGRTCIYLDGDKIKIRNGNSNETKQYSIPRHGVIYVEGNRKDKGYGNFHDKFNLEDANVFVSGTLKGRLTIASENNIYITAIDPTNWDIPQRFTSSGIEYYGTKFNGKKDGTGTGEEEMSAWDNKKEIYTRYALKKNSGDGKDMLGLVANEDVMIMHYGWFKEKNENDYNDEAYYYDWVKEYIFWPFWYKNKKVAKKIDVAPKNININAAIFALNGGFGFENYDMGNPMGNIKVWGNITQYERKEVGTFNSNNGKNITGYKKKYAHDPRMLYDYPPHILEPVNVGWEVIDWKEINEHLEGDD